MWFTRVLKNTLSYLWWRDQLETQLNEFFLFDSLHTQLLDFLGGFQLEFVSISRVINHMTCYKFECSHWLKLQHSDWRANLVKDFFLNKFSTNESTRIITGHVIYNLAYTYKFQLKTTIDTINIFSCWKLNNWNLWLHCTVVYW